MQLNSLPYEQVSAAVHDLKNPISSILSLTELILRSPEGTLNEKDLRTTIELIQRLTRQMSGLTLQIIPSARTGATLSRHSVGELLDEARQLWQPMASEQGIGLHASLDLKPCFVNCEKDEILRVFSNLIGNAVRFSKRGTAIAMGADIVGSTVRIRVEDQGCGIPTEHLERIFEKYWQANPRKSPGMGLGLSIAREIIDEHGGKIWAEGSPNGRGSVFYFTLPLLA